MDYTNHSEYNNHHQIILDDGDDVNYDLGLILNSVKI